MALFTAAAAHAILNRRRFKALLHGRRNAVGVVSIVAIAGLAICFVGQLASALVLSKFAFGFLPVLPGPPSRAESTCCARIGGLCWRLPMPGCI